MLPVGELELLMYQDTHGWRPFAYWLQCLDLCAAQKVTDVLQRMAAGNLGDVKSVGAGVLERRINWGPGYRVYFGRDGARLIILLGGGTKQQQEHDIEEAHSKWADYKRRRQRPQKGEA